MAAPELSRLAVSITAHSWNADKTRVALCPNNNEIRIYAKQGADFNLEHVLTEHDSVVTSIDWAPKTNKILSCSQDRNAYVWNFQNGVWKPTLVILRINRGATQCKWSPREDKFVVASAEKLVSVCYFEKDSDWWVSKHIKKHESTVLDVAWHPNNILLATVGSDSKCRIVSAFVKGIDKKEDVSGGTAFGDRLPFGTHLKDFDANGWVHAVKWSPSGNQLAYASHDSTLSIVECSTQEHTTQTVRYRYLPLVDLLWVNENSIVGVGHDCNPFLFQKQGANWQFTAALDQKSAKAGPGLSTKEMWVNKTERADGSQDRELGTKHQNCVTCIRPVAGAPNAVTSFSTTGLDGNIIMWQTKALETQLGVKF
jgi:actin related protein 2/3 complex subunit 1A/1B